MKSKCVEHRLPSAPGAFRLLSPEETDSLRQEMQASSQWMKAEIERRRFQGGALQSTELRSSAQAEPAQLR